MSLCMWGSFLPRKSSYSVTPKMENLNLENAEHKVKGKVKNTIPTLLPASCNHCNNLICGH
jgi:nitrate reductase beta subunit